MADGGPTLPSLFNVSSVQVLEGALPRFTGPRRPRRGLRVSWLNLSIFERASGCEYKWAAHRVFVGLPRSANHV